MSWLNPRIAVFFGLLGLWSCTPKATTTTSGSYKEDLSSLRPGLVVEETPQDTSTKSEPVEITYVEPKDHLKSELDSIVSMTTVYNAQKNYVEGFTVQVYTGVSRDDASRAQVKIYSVFEDANPWIDYHQPIYKVKVGRFYSKFDANAYYKELKKKFPAALIIPQKFKLN